MIYWHCKKYDQMFTEPKRLLAKLEKENEASDTVFEEAQKTSIRV